MTRPHSLSDLVTTYTSALLCVLTATGFLLEDRQPCSLCGSPIDVTLTVKNDFRPPYFNVSVTLRNTAQRELILLMQEAADVDGRFNFTASYRGGLGFFVETINGQSGDWAKDGSWWHTYSQEPGTHAHCEGVSSFVPGHKESVVFLLTNRTLLLPDCPQR